MENNQLHANGQRDAVATLNAWKSMGFASREASRVHQLAEMKKELAYARQHTIQGQIDYCEGWLSVLER